MISASGHLFLSLLLELALLGRGVLVLLVLGHQVVHVALCLSELHLIHALAGVPMEEGLSAEHGGELLGDALEQLLDGRAVADEGGGHLETTWRDVAHGCLDVVGDPFHKVAAVLVLHIQHLLVHLLHRHASTEDGGHCQVAAVARVAGGHHVLGVKHLLSEFGHRERSVLLAAAAGQGGKAGHEEVQTWEGHHVDSQFAEVGIELAGETQACCHTAHGGRDQVVEVAVSGCGEFEGTEADVVQGLVVDAVGLICVLNQLVDR